LVQGAFEGAHGAGPIAVFQSTVSLPASLIESLCVPSGQLSAYGGRFAEFLELKFLHDPQGFFKSFEHSRHIPLESLNI